MTDESLMLCIKEGDLDKAAILYERYKKKLYQFFLYRNNNDGEKSEDCVQQVFYQLIRYRHTYIEERNFRTWIYSIARNIQYGEYQKQLRADDYRAGNQPVEGYTQTNDDHRALHQALEELPAAQRELLLMSKFLGMKYEEIAEANECSVGVIKVRVFRAMKNLREVYFKIT